MDFIRSSLHPVCVFLLDNKGLFLYTNSVFFLTKIIFLIAKKKYKRCDSSKSSGGNSISQKGGKIYQATQIINHARYNGDTFNFDFALLELAKAIEFDDRTIKAIPLPNVYDFVSVHKMCFISGWGTSNYLSKELPIVLQGARIPIVSNAKCQQALSTYGYNVTEQMMCAGFRNGSKDCKSVKNNSNFNGIFEKNLVCLISQLVKEIVVAQWFVPQSTVNENCSGLFHGEKIVGWKMFPPFMRASKPFVFGLRSTLEFE